MDKDVKDSGKTIKDTRKKAQKLAKKKGKKAIKFAGKALKKSKPLPMFTIFETTRTNLLFVLLASNGIFFLLSLVQIIWGSIAGKELNEALKVSEFKTAQRVNLATLMGVLAGFQMILTIFSTWINYFIYKGGETRRNWSRTNYFLSWAELLNIFILLIFLIVITVAVEQVQTVVDQIFKKGMRSDKYLKMKPIIDKMQSTHQCCGLKKPDEWFTNGWQEALQQDGSLFQIVGNSVPASCCMRDAPPPCINRNVINPGIRNGYNWQNGHKVSVNQNGCSKIISSYLNDKFIYPFKCYIGILLALSVIKFIIQRVLETSITEACKYDTPFTADDPAYGYIFKGWGSTPPNLLEDASKIYAHELCKQGGVDPDVIFGEGETITIVMDNLGCKTVKECSNFIKKCEEDFKERLNEDSDENHKYNELLRLAEELETSASQFQDGGKGTVKKKKDRKKQEIEDDEKEEENNENGHIENSAADNHETEDNDDNDYDENDNGSEKAREQEDEDGESVEANSDLGIEKKLPDKQLMGERKENTQVLKESAGKLKKQGPVVQKKTAKTKDNIEEKGENRTKRPADEKVDKGAKARRNPDKDSKNTQGKQTDRTKKAPKDKEEDNAKVKQSPSAKAEKGDSNVKKSQKETKSKVRKDNEKREKTKASDKGDEQKDRQIKNDKLSKKKNEPDERKTTTKKQKQGATTAQSKKEAAIEQSKDQNPKNTGDKVTKRAKSPRVQGKNEDGNEKGKARKIRFSSRKLSDFVGSPIIQFGEYKVHEKDEIVHKLGF